MPYHLHHPETGGTTTAATESSLRVLEVNGWERLDKPLPPPPEPPDPVGFPAWPLDEQDED